ncbi:MAG: hypothetical protein M1819_000989 [Sarea resinae]|nr:MAG: hypothetical protein M1819_000989 [Sarea resinae]
MRLPRAIAILAVLPTVLCTTSSKRGLCFVPSQQHPSDDNIWDSSTSDLTWYYNYGATPSTAFNNATHLQFVPMLWGAPANSTDTSFSGAITAQLAAGANISSLLSFNEPDSSADGGSGVPALLAAQTWIRELEPLRTKHNLSLGAPAVTGSPQGFTWLQEFFTACNGNCTADFIPVHWYGDFGGLASHIGQVRAAYGNMSIWVTEFAEPGVNLAESETFYNQSSSYFDRIDYITHYSYFGAFRSSASNVGPNAAMLTKKGKLTDIGSWYLGGASTGNKPSSAPQRTVSSSMFGGVGLWGMGLMWVLVVGVGVW